jgi:hypothetical protein
MKISLTAIGWLVLAGCLAAVCSLSFYAGAGLWYWEQKGPFKNATQVVDWEGDGDLDVIISHTRWEDLDLSWAGIGIWVNQGDGTFELIRDRGKGTYPFGGYAAAAGDIDRDGDLDLFTQDFAIHLHLNQGGLQAGLPGEFRTLGGINVPAAYNQGYRDMGGTITMADLNADNLPDAFIAGCCYGMDAEQAEEDFPHAPAISWTWINDGREGNLQAGHILPQEALDGLPIRQVAHGDLDGDGDLDLYAAVGEPTIGTLAMLDDLLLLNDGQGNLAVTRVPGSSTDSTSAALGDANGDGHLDVLVGTDRGAQLLLNQGNEEGSGAPLFTLGETSFEPVQLLADRLGAGISALADRLLGLYIPYGSTQTRAVFLEDLDGDGDLDVLLASLWGAEVWINDGQGDFMRQDQALDYPEDTGVAVADFDGDGDLDIFTGRNEDSYQVWWNDGLGRFTGRR